VVGLLTATPSLKNPTAKQVLTEGAATTKPAYGNVINLACVIVNFPNTFEKLVKSLSAVITVPTLKQLAATLTPE